MEGFDLRVRVRVRVRFLRMSGTSGMAALCGISRTLAVASRIPDLRVNFAFKKSRSIVAI